MTEILAIPEPSLVLLIGPSGSGKSTFAARHFRATEIISSDRCRGLVCDDESAVDVNDQAFAVVHAIARARLALGKLAVIDATNVQPEARAPLVNLARDADLFAVAIVLNVPQRLCEERNSARPARSFGPHVVRGQANQLRRSLGNLRREGLRYVHVLNADQVDSVTIERTPLWTDRRTDTGPFDIIGDVHGCLDELRLLLDRLGYVPDAEELPTHPDGRRLMFVGDLVDRGPDSPGVLDLVRRLVASRGALCVVGNHDDKLLRKLRGKNVKIAHGLAQTLEQIEALPAELRAQFEVEAPKFLDSLVSHYVLDGGRLVLAHAGMKAEYQGRSSSRVREFGLFGETTGETDEFGLPVRHRWAADYRGRALVVYGHTPVSEPDRLNGTINIDTGCVFGGKLTALRYPENELVAVPALRTYAEPVRPFLAAGTELVATDLRGGDDLLRVEDVTGKRIVETGLMGSLTIRAEQAGPALEILSRFAVDPRWLVYVPPTMAPCGSCKSGVYLEHPSEAFAEYRHEGVESVVCQEKHMGSRAIVVVCRTPDIAVRRFRFDEPSHGIILTRTGRRFFEEAAVEVGLLERLNEALRYAGLWDELATDWVVLDAELLPWSAKASALLREQYAPVGAAGSADLALTSAALDSALARGVALGPVLERVRDRARELDRYADAYQRYCWPTAGLAGLKLAPFHLLACEGHSFFDRDHVWHMQTLARLAAADPEFVTATPWQLVKLSDEAEQAAATSWWVERTESGMEGMVVKPVSFIVKDGKGLRQPALKVRGRDYLRVIYGPEYALPENLERLRPRALGRKQSLALREFALGVEALERFVRGEPLYRVHECVAGVLALESEPVDPRL